MNKTALSMNMGQSRLDQLVNKGVLMLPYGLMWYGNLLADPNIERMSSMTPEEKRRSMIRSILKGVVFSGTGYAATRTLFPNDFKVRAGDKKAKGLAGLLGSTYSTENPEITKLNNQGVELQHQVEDLEEQTKHGSLIELVQSVMGKQND